MHLSPIFTLASLFPTLCGVHARAAPPANHVGTLFLFEPATGACGFTNTSSQLVASVPRQVFMTYPGANPSNPNKNPICHHSVSVAYEGKNVKAQVVDYFADPQPNNVGLTRPGFTVFAPESDGLVPNVNWTVV